MNDPHVVALHYRIDHGRQFDYSKAKRRHFEVAEFFWKSKTSEFGLSLRPTTLQKTRRGTR